MLRSLPLHEEIALLALRNDRGTVAGGVMYTQAAGGALLAELLLTGHLATEGAGKKAVVVVAKNVPTGNEVLDECLAKVASAKRRGQLSSWVQRFASLRKLHARVAKSLVEKRVLREDEGRILFLFTRRTYPELDPASEHDIRARIEAAIASDDGVVDPRTSVLIAIAHHSGLLKTNFDKAHLKARKVRLTAVAKGEAVGDATKQAIEAAQAAMMMVAIMTPVIHIR